MIQYYNRTYHLRTCKISSKRDHLESKTYANKSLYLRQIIVQNSIIDSFECAKYCISEIKEEKKFQAMFGLEPSFYHFKKRI